MQLRPRGPKPGRMARATPEAVRNFVIDIIRIMCYDISDDGDCSRIGSRPSARIGPATTRATCAGHQSVWSKPALFLARGIRSGGLAVGPPVGGELGPRHAPSAEDGGQ